MFANTGRSCSMCDARCEQACKGTPCSHLQSAPEPFNGGAWHEIDGPDGGARDCSKTRARGALIGAGVIACRAGIGAICKLTVTLEFTAFNEPERLCIITCSTSISAMISSSSSSNINSSAVEFATEIGADLSPTFPFPVSTFARAGTSTRSRIVSFPDFPSRTLDRRVPGSGRFKRAYGVFKKSITLCNPRSFSVAGANAPSSTRIHTRASLDVVSFRGAASGFCPSSEYANPSRVVDASAVRPASTRMAFRPALARRRATARADDGKLSRSLALHRRSIARAIGGATHCDVSARGASIVFASAFV